MCSYPTRTTRRPWWGARGFGERESGRSRRRRGGRNRIQVSVRATDSEIEYAIREHRPPFDRSGGHKPPLLLAGRFIEAIEVVIVAPKIDDPAGHNRR